MPSTTPVLIVGAGPTGLVLALSLVRQGIAFRIVDRNGGPGLASRAMVVQARTLEFYRMFGIAEAVVERGIPVAAAHLRQGGAEVAQLPLGTFGTGLSAFPFVLSFAQDDHERFLVDRLAAAGVTVEWNTDLLSFTQDAGGVRAILARGGVETECQAGWICGCDGAHSRVRQGLGLGFPGGTYDQRFYVADARLVGALRPDLFFNLGAHAFAIMLPVRSSGMHRLIGIVPPELAARESLAFEDIRPSAEALSGARVERLNWFSTYRVHHRVAAHFRVGRACIAGDAGHIHSPAGGQGMNTGIGDAVNLAWKLAAVIQGRATEAILDSYDTERTRFARGLVRSTDQAFRGMVNPGWAGRLFRTWLLPRLLPRLVRSAAARRTIFGTVGQLRIRYRGSALSQGRVGAVVAGDRLPWVPQPHGDNHAALDGLDWRLQVHGTVTPALTAAAEGLGLALDGIPWSMAAGRAGLRRDAAYLIRPDGHVGWASRRQDAAALHAYVGRHGLAFRHSLLPA